jgi:hypothetical protein
VRAWRGRSEKLAIDQPVWRHAPRGGPLGAWLDHLRRYCCALNPRPASGPKTWKTWWFGTFGLFFHILGVIIPTDFHIFQRGRYINHQLWRNLYLGGATLLTANTSMSIRRRHSHGFWSCRDAGVTVAPCMDVLACTIHDPLLDHWSIIFVYIHIYLYIYI